MSYPENSIGGYQFADLTGAIFRKQQELELFNRAGVAGTGLRALGVRGKPFVVKSTVFVADYQAAHDLMLDYIDLKATVPQTLIRCDIDHGDFWVLEVNEETLAPVIRCTGNADPGSTVRMTTIWHLLG